MLCLQHIQRHSEPGAQPLAMLIPSEGWIVLTYMQRSHTCQGTKLPMEGNRMPLLTNPQLLYFVVY